MFSVLAVVCQNLCCLEIISAVVCLSCLLQALHNDNMSLKAEIQNLQAQISDQVSYVPSLFFQI